jgi:hypothetical protein
MAFVRRETRTAGGGSPAQQRSALRGLPLAAAAGLSLLAAACGGGSSRAYGRAKGFLRLAGDARSVTVLQPSTSYNGLMTFRALALVGMTGLTLAASACGGSSAGKVAQVGTTGANQPHAHDPQAFSACMRSHGVPTFPDPDSSGTIHVPSSIDDLPTAKAAYRACRSLAPSEGSLTGQGDVMRQDQLLAFAKCMRSHRVPNFPDPQVVNGHIADMHATGQIDPSSPIVTAAMAACRSTLGANSAAGAEKLVQGAASRPPGGKGGKGK